MRYMNFHKEWILFRESWYNYKESVKWARTEKGKGMEKMAREKNFVERMQPINHL